MNHTLHSKEIPSAAPSRSTPTPSPKFPQPGPKTLSFDTPNRLVNRLGEKFDIKIKHLYEGKACQISLSSKERGAGELNVEILLLAFPDENKVIISSIKQGSGITISYDKPPEENTGYGIMRLALVFAKALAKKEGITRISTTPSCHAVRSHYKKFGFVQAPPEESSMCHSDIVLYLQD